MKSAYSRSCIAAIMASAGLVGVDEAAAEPKNVGSLTCTAVAAAPDEGQLSCTFDPAGKDGVVEYYAGRLPDVKLSPTEKTIVVWNVRSSTSSVAPGGLEGTYTSSAGGNVLVGRDVFLEPLTSQPGGAPNTANELSELKLQRNRPRV